MIDKAPSLPNKNFSELEKTQIKLKEALAEIEILKAEVHRLSIDSMTGLLGIAVLKPRLNSLIQELNHKNENRPSTLNAVMVIALDMNGLKFFNDHFNHTVGDQAIVSFSNRLREVVKIDDLIFRPKGADEFTIVMPIRPFDHSLSKVDFDEIFQRVVNAINTDLFIEVENKKYPITTSAGYSVLKKGEQKTSSELLEEADKEEREHNKFIKNNKKIVINI